MSSGKPAKAAMIYTGTIEVQEDRIYIFGQEVSWDMARDMIGELKACTDIAEAHWLAVEGEALKQEYRTLKRLHGVNQQDVARICGFRDNELSKTLNAQYRQISVLRWRVRAVRNAIQHLKILIREGEPWRP